MRKLILCSLILALGATPAYAKGNSHSGSSSNSGSSHSSSSSNSSSDHSSSSSDSGSNHSSTSTTTTANTSNTDQTNTSTTTDHSNEKKQKELDKRFEDAANLQSTELKNYADELKKSLSSDQQTTPEQSKYYSKLSEMYDKSGDLSSAIQTKEQEIQTNYTNLDSVKKLGELYSKAGNTDVKTLINGHQSHFDTPPVIKDGHTLIPIRGVSESLKADVQWDSTAQTITINRDGTTIVLTVGSNVATINGESVTLDAPSSIMNGRAFVPLR
ncbi:MAG TPA: stalk domain-containing protein, partial [Bacillota bacterium]|nr:stalk domain-containing protein [Bacillota bacterium]